MRYAVVIMHSYSYDSTLRARWRGAGADDNALVGRAAGSADAATLTVQAEQIVRVQLSVLKQLIRNAISEAEPNHGGEDDGTQVGETFDACRKAPTRLHHPFRNLVEEPSVLPLVLEHMAGVGLVAVVDGASPNGPRADDVVFSFPKAL